MTDVASPWTKMELSLTRGVYRDMFEQSILLADTGKRNYALFASFSAQIAAIGVSILVPLIYTKTLPLARPSFLMLLPKLQPPQREKKAKPAVQTARPGVLQAPFRIPTRIVEMERSSSPAASLSLEPGAPVPSGDASVPLINLAPVMPRFDPPAEPAAAPSVGPALMRAPIQVGGAVQSAKIVKKVVPTYPPVAKQARISGTVRLMGVVARDGTIQNLQVISGHPLLQKAAIEAVRQWIYQPTILDGQAVEVLAPIEVIFTLSR